MFKLSKAAIIIGWLGDHPKDGWKTKRYPRSLGIFSKLALRAMRHQEL